MRGTKGNDGPGSGLCADRAIRPLSGLVMLVVVLCTAAGVLAAPLFYTPPAIDGLTVSYTTVSESSGTDPLPLYGTPGIIGDTLIFRNMSFSATSVVGSPVIDFTDGQLNLTITAKQGYFLTDINWFEKGDYFVFVPPSATGSAYVRASSPGLLITVLEVGGVPISPLYGTAPVVFAPSGGDFQSGVDPDTGVWTGTGSANLVSLFNLSNITKVSVNVDNQLLAFSSGAAVASISKKIVDVEVLTVPEPAALSLLALAGVLTLRRRAA